MAAVTGSGTGVTPLPGTSSSGNINFADIKSPSQISDDAALKIVRRDAEFTRSWIESRYFNIRWIEIDLLYQSPPTLRVWEGTSMPKANIAKFTVATHVNAINSKLVGGLFYEEPPFRITAKSNITANTARAIEEVSSWQLDHMNFKQEVKLGFFSCLLNGTGIWKWGWKDYHKTEWDFEPIEQPIRHTDPITGATTETPTQDSDKFKMTRVERLYSHPSFENCDIRTVLVDPGCRTPDIRDAKFVIHEFPVSYRDLIRMSEEIYYNENDEPIYRYNLPSEEEIRSWFETPQAMDESRFIAGQNITTGQNNTQFVQHAAPLFNKTTEDPLDEPLLIQERWDNDKVLTVLAGQRVIRNEPNPFGKIPFYSVNWWMIQDCFWGLGLGTSLGGEQRLQQGFINAVADIGTLAANQPIIRSRGANINTQQVRARLGGFIDVDGDATKALHPMDIPKIQGELFQVVSASEARTETTSGANDQLTMGASRSSGRGSSMGRTATGAGNMMQAAVDRIGGLVEDFNRQVFQPWLWQMYDLSRMFLPASVYRQILNDALATDLQATFQDFMSGKKGIKTFNVLAGSHLAARQQMAQSMPLIMQYFSNPALAGQVADINGEYIDFSELLHMLTDVSGWGGSSYYSIFKKLTPQMKAQRAAQNPNAQKMQAQMALNKQKGDIKSDQQEQQWTQRAAGDIIRHSLEQAGSAEAITGSPGGVGFGGGELEA
jgi:hypothetical protein